MVIGWDPEVLIMETAEDKQFVDHLLFSHYSTLGAFHLRLDTGSVHVWESLLSRLKLLIPRGHILRLDL